MDNKRKHTPTPWVLNRHTGTKQLDTSTYDIFGGIELDSAGTRETVLDGGIIWERSNAEFIVRACNSHEALLKVAQEALEYLCGPLVPNKPDYLIETLFNKIERARGEETCEK